MVILYISYIISLFLPLNFKGYVYQVRDNK